MGLIIFSDAEKQNRNLLLLVRFSLMIVFGILTLVKDPTKPRDEKRVDGLCTQLFRLKFAIKLLLQFPSKL